MKKKVTVTIGIPAYNEEANIGYLIDSILNQERTSYVIESIVVLNDGSTDKTKNMVLNLAQKNAEISCLDDGNRLGKIERLNQVFKMNKSNILILFDADLMLSSTNVIESMISKFEKGVALVCPDKYPLQSKTFIEKLINYLYDLFYQIRIDLHGGDNLHNFTTCAFGITEEFAKKLYYPKNIYPITKFTYLAAIKNGLKFKLAKEVRVYYRSPNNLKDYCLQVNRFSNVLALNKLYYGIWIDNVAHIPLLLKVKVFLRMFLSNPFLFILAIMLRIYVRFKRKGTSGSIWELAVSSKKLI